MRLIFLLVLSLALTDVSDVSAAQDARGEAHRYFIQGKWMKAIESYNALPEPMAEDLIRLGEAYLYAGNYQASKQAIGRSIRMKETPEGLISLQMIDAIIEQGREEAMGKLISLLDMMPGSPRLWRAVGIAHMLGGPDMEEKAIYYFYGAAERDPGDYMSYFFIGLIYETGHEFDEAIKVYKKAVKINPDFAQALNNLGYVYKERHYYTYAIDMYRRAIAVDLENAGYYYNVGNAYTHKNMIKEAFDSYKKAIELDPAFAKAHYNMGQTYLRMEMLPEALDELKLYLKYWDRGIPAEDAPPPEAVEAMIEEVEEMLEGGDR